MDRKTVHKGEPDWGHITALNSVPEELDPGAKHPVKVLRYCQEIFRERARDHGDYDETMKVLATLLSGAFKHKLAIPLDASDAAMVYVLTKVARMMTGDPLHGDNKLDMINYLAMSVSLSEQELET